MKSVWKKTLLVALPLAGLFFTAPAAEAHRRHDCRPRYEQGRQGGIWYDDYRDRRGYDQRRPYYSRDDYRPYRYPSRSYGRPYYDRPYYDDYPWWQHLSGR
ncbi:MAG: hypothetical protein HYZ50_26530 [Deltaproteobacteria bacterium]|nr:hypothetical protein [Deltaproteobacteria bacterium]